jgi:hypothetical protein
MPKPKVMVIDWKPESFYKAIADIVSIRRSFEMPQTVEGLDAIIIHGADPSAAHLAKEARKYNVPLLLHGCIEQVESCIRRKCKGYDNVHFFERYEPLFEYVRKIFSK